MKVTWLSAAVLLLLVPVVPGCSGEPSPDAGTVDGGVPYDGIRVEVRDGPPAMDFVYKGARLTGIASGATPAFYLVSNGNKVEVRGPFVKKATGEALELSAVTADGRKALVTAGPGSEGSAVVSFRVEGKKRDELLGIRFQVGGDEGFYGLMERTVQGEQDESWKPGITEGLNLRGQEVFLYVMSTLSVYSPFYVSSAGYGVHVESSWPGIYRFGKTDKNSVELEYEGGELPLRVIPGPSPLEVTEKYARISGLPFLPPEWAFSPWRWRDNHYNLPAFYDGTPNTTPYNSMVVEDVLMMEALGIPNAIYWVDRPWGPGGFGYDDLKWDESRLPNPGRMIEWLKSKGTGFMLWIAPWAVGDMADEAVARGFTVKDETPFMPPAQAKLIDLTNEEAVAWWQGRLIERIGDGVAGFKLDRGDEKVPDGILATGRYHNGMDYREGRNLYPVLYARAVADAFRKAGVGEFMAMPRAAWAGSSAHAVPWGGDAAPSQEGLRMSIIAVQRAAAMNFPVWGSDTCGYDSVYDTACDREVCMRWLAFSAFTPLMEVGPTFDAAPWSRPPEGTKDNIVDEGGYHYAPVYDEDLIAAWIFYARLHHDLRRYTRSLAEAASAHGTPIVRPMALAYPARPEYRDIFDQYLYGPDILVAPIWRKGVGSRDVSLPDGVWIDAWTGKEAVGGTVAAVDTPLPKIPIFLRKGAGVSLGDLDSRLSEAAARAKNRPNLDDLQKDVN